MNTELMKAVEAVRTALNDWTATYASEFCDEDAVAAAHKRMSVRGALSYICGAHGELDKISQALRDLEAENAILERHRCHEHIVAENTLALLRECDAVARKRGDKYGLCDAIDNDGQPYQSQHLAAHLGADHEG